MLLSWGEVLVSDESRLLTLFRGPLVNQGDPLGLGNLSGTTAPLQRQIKEEKCSNFRSGCSLPTELHWGTVKKLKVIKSRVKMVNGYIR